MVFHRFKGFFMPVFHFRPNPFHAKHKVNFLGQKEAMKIDQELFNDYNFGIDQLMELAGLSCAVSVAKCYPLTKIKKPCLLVCCGPGNNGGEGLVCARHLKMFGYSPAILYPYPTERQPFNNLTVQCKGMDIPFLADLPECNDLNTRYSLIIDALFGINFKPPPAPEFASILGALQKVKTPICSIDIPSGWDVDKGLTESGGIHPEMLISITAPKKGVCAFKGKHHYLGGRFVPPRLASKYELSLPSYSGTNCCVRLK